MKKIIITAIDKERGIGKDGDIPWHYSEDMKFFKEKTMGNPVLMGRKTYESLPEDYRPLPGRKNIVLTRSDKTFHESVSKANSLEEAWKKSSNEKIFIIGGAGVYIQTLEKADKMILTKIKENYEGDTYFPEYSENKWKEVKREKHEEFDFIEYKRN